MSGQCLVEDTGARLWATANKLVTHPKFSIELGDAIRQEGGAERAVVAMLSRFGLVAPSSPVVEAVPLDPPVVDWATPIAGDEVAVRLLSEGNSYSLAEATRLVAAWRQLAIEHDYNGPILWDVRAGFTLKQHAPSYGPCHKNFSYLQGWRFEDVPTAEGLKFWIPRFLKDSRGKNKNNQLKLLAQVRDRFTLPDYQLTSFGEASLLAALILSHFKVSGERVPLGELWTRTDSLRTDGDRLILGGFDEAGFACAHWDWGVREDGGLGCFLLGAALGR